MNEQSREHGAGLGFLPYISEGVGTLDTWSGWRSAPDVYCAVTEPTNSRSESSSIGSAGSGAAVRYVQPQYSPAVIWISFALVSLALFGFWVTA